MTKECPKCETSRAVRIIHWLMPKGELDPSKYVVGGRIVPKNGPDYIYLICSTEFDNQKN